MTYRDPTLATQEIIEKLERELAEVKTERQQAKEQVVTLRAELAEAGALVEKNLRGPSWTAFIVFAVVCLALAGLFNMIPRPVRPPSWLDSVTNMTLRLNDPAGRHCSVRSELDGLAWWPEVGGFIRGNGFTRSAQLHRWHVHVACDHEALYDGYIYPNWPDHLIDDSNTDGDGLLDLNLQTNTLVVDATEFRF